MSRKYEAWSDSTLIAAYYSKGIRGVHDEEIMAELEHRERVTKVDYAHVNKIIDVCERIEFRLGEPKLPDTKQN